MYIKGKVMFPLCILLNRVFYCQYESYVSNADMGTWINMDKLPFARLYVRLHQSWDTILDMSHK